MVHSSSIFSMQDARGILNKAMDAPSGIRIAFDTHGAAVRLRQRCYTIRNREQIASRKTYQENDPRWGTSPWDLLMLLIKEENGTFYLYVTHDPEEAAKVAYKVEEL